MFLPREPRIGDDIDAVKLTVRMKSAYVRPYVRTLSQVVLAVRAFKSLRYAALISIMPHHVTTVLVTAVTVRALMTGQETLAVVDAMGALQGPLQERIWKKRVHSRLVRKERVNIRRVPRANFFVLVLTHHEDNSLVAGSGGARLELRDSSREEHPAILLRYRKYRQGICTVEKVMSVGSPQQCW